MNVPGGRSTGTPKDRGFLSLGDARPSKACRVLSQGKARRYQVVSAVLEKVKLQETTVPSLTAILRECSASALSHTVVAGSPRREREYIPGRRR